MDPPNPIQIDTKTLINTLEKIGRLGDSVYSARETSRYIFIQFVGDREETRVSKPKKRKAKKVRAEPVKPPAPEMTEPVKPPAPEMTTDKETRGNKTVTTP